MTQPKGPKGDLNHFIAHPNIPKDERESSRLTHKTLKRLGDNHKIL